MKTFDFDEYSQFVQAVTSQPSLDLSHLISRLHELNSSTNISRLLTGLIGLSSESGELAEIVKKCVFQGKPFDQETVFHLKRELGDIAFYFVTACGALGLNPADVFEENITKLRSRYPNGFEVSKSENRKPGDL